MSYRNSNQIYTQNFEPTFYERVPEIIDYVTYIEKVVDKKTGEERWIRKRLDVYAKELYRILKSIAGTNGCSWMGALELAKRCNMSEGKISDAKKQLAQSFEQLDGNSLIHIEEKRVPTMKENKMINKKPQHIITINNNWRANHDFMKTFREDKDFREYYWNKYITGVITEEEAINAMENMRSKIVHNLEAGSSNESGRQATSSHDSVPQMAQSPHDISHTHNSHTQMNKSYPTASLLNDFFNKKGIDEKMNHLPDQVLTWLQKNGVWKIQVKKLIDKFGFPILSKAIEEVENRKYVKNKGAYVQRVCEELFYSS